MRRALATRSTSASEGMHTRLQPLVFDALAESKNGLVAYAVIDERRAAWLGPDGGFDVGAYSGSLARAQAVVIASSLILYIVTPLVAAALIAKVLHLV